MDETNNDLQTIVVKIKELKYVNIFANSVTVSIEETFLNELEWLREIVVFTKSFADFTHKRIESPFQDTETETYKLTNKSPFLKYKDDIKVRYQKMMYLLKGVYRNALKLPDVEKIHHTIIRDFNNYNHLHLKNPEFIFDYFVYHLYDYSQINEKYPFVLEGLKIFEYLYYRIINHIKELEFDAEDLSSDIRA